MSKSLFVSINHIPVKPDRAEDFERMFKERDRGVEKMEGFISLDLVRPGTRAMMGGPEVPGTEYQVLTRWESREAFNGWVHSDEFKKAHSRPVDGSIFAGKSYLTLHDTVEGVGVQKNSVEV